MLKIINFIEKLILTNKMIKMELQELGRILKEMYETAPSKSMVAMIHLFGIKYAEEIKNCSCSNIEIIEEAGLNKSYKVELSKGIKLSEYVTPK